MAKRSVVFITLLTVLIFIIGCSATQTEALKPRTLEAPKAEPPKIEPAKVELPKSELPRPEPAPGVSFHDKCAHILKNFVDDKGMVDYRTLKQRKPELKKLLDEFDKLDPNEYSRWPREDKIAFWVNAYNIQLLKIIVDNYPIQSPRIFRVLWPPTSIRHIRGIWNKYKFIVMDEEFTLAEIEQRFFSGQFSEPRTFLAVSYASLGGPALRNEPYRGDKLARQLDEQVGKFLSRPEAFKIDREDKTVYLSAIFQNNWHGNEFTSKYGTDKKFKDRQPDVRAVLNFITNYISERDVSFLEVENYSIKYINYDWRLNDS